MHESVRDRAGPPVPVLVIGAGVSGLTTALCLQREGHTVTIVAEKFAPGITSVVAGALWEWPPAICGHFQDSAGLARAKVWSGISYGVFAELANNPQTGVFMRMANFYFRSPVEDDQRLLRKMNELRNHVREFRHDASHIARNGINPESGVRDVYAHLSPLVDTDAYLKWLLEQVKTSGCRIIPKKLKGSLRDQETVLKQEWGVETIVNCSGLGSAELARDPMYPLRGALVRMRNDGKRFPRITEAHCLASEGITEEPGFIFIVPRGHDMLVLGGIAEPDQCGLEIGLHNYEPIQNMYKRCVDFLPILRTGEIDPTEPVRVGLRPFRQQHVRLEHESGTSIIHNYGHGGSGVTFSWGCAQEVVELVRKMNT